MGLLIGGMGGEREGSGECWGNVLLWAGGNMVPEMSWDIRRWLDILLMLRLGFGFVLDD